VHGQLLIWTQGLHGISQLASVGVGEVQLKALPLAAPTNWCTNLLLLLLTAIELSLGGSSPYTSIDKTNKNKYT
jgi:hypothetical protein